MTENRANPDNIQIKILDEEENYFIVEELDETDNPLELNRGENFNQDASMEVFVRRSWNYAETKEMLTLFKENRHYIDLMRVKDKYEFITNKLNEQNPDKPISAATLESKIKSLIRSYRLNRSRKDVCKTDLDRDLEEIFGVDRLLSKQHGEIKVEACESNFEVNYNESDEHDESMDATNAQEDSSEGEFREMDSLHPTNRNITPLRRWDYAETKRMLAAFKENKRYTDRLRKSKEKYEFIAKKLTDGNPEKPISAATLQSKIKGMIRTYRSKLIRKKVPRTDIDRDLEEVVGIERLRKHSLNNTEQPRFKLEMFQNNLDKSNNFNLNDDYFGDYDAETNISNTLVMPAAASSASEFLTNPQLQTSQIRYQAQATQTDLGDNMLIQLVQIEKNQHQRWQEEKAFFSRLERAKSERFARKELLLQELINVLKSRAQ